MSLRRRRWEAVCCWMKLLNIFYSVLIETQLSEMQHKVKMFFKCVFRNLKFFTKNVSIPIILLHSNICFILSFIVSNVQIGLYPNFFEVSVFMPNITQIINRILMIMRI